MEGEPRSDEPEKAAAPPSPLKVEAVSLELDDDENKKPDDEAETSVVEAPKIDVDHTFRTNRPSLGEAPWSWLFGFLGKGWPLGCPGNSTLVISRERPWYVNCTIVALSTSSVGDNASRAWYSV